MEIKKITTWVIVMLLGIITVACASVDEKNDGVETIRVGAKQVDCTGVAPQKCLLIKKKEDKDWTLFYQNIEGFTYTEGYEYELKVKKEKVSPTPADASSIKYVLVKVLSKSKVQ